MEGSAANFVQSIQGVTGDVQTNLKQLIRICQNPGKIVAQHDIELDFVGAELRLRQLERGLRDRVQVDRKLLCRSLAGKIQQAGNQNLRAPDLLRNLLG